MLKFVELYGEFYSKLQKEFNNFGISGEIVNAK